MNFVKLIKNNKLILLLIILIIICLIGMIFVYDYGSVDFSTEKNIVNMDHSVSLSNKDSAKQLTLESINSVVNKEVSDSYNKLNKKDQGAQIKINDEISSYESHTLSLLNKLKKKNPNDLYYITEEVWSLLKSEDFKDKAEELTYLNMLQIILEFMDLKYSDSPFEMVYTLKNINTNLFNHSMNRLAEIISPDDHNKIIQKLKAYEYMLENGNG